MGPKNVFAASVTGGMLFSACLTLAAAGSFGKGSCCRSENSDGRFERAAAGECGSVPTFDNGSQFPAESETFPSLCFHRE